MLHEGGQTHTKRQDERPGPVKPAWRSGPSSLVHLQGSDPGKAGHSRLPKKPSCPWSFPDFRNKSESQRDETFQVLLIRAAGCFRLCLCKRHKQVVQQEVKHTHVPLPLTHAGRTAALRRPEEEQQPSEDVISHMNQDQDQIQAAHASCT